MGKPRVCISIVNKNLEAIKEVEAETDLFEVRMDLIGPDWVELVHLLTKPWIACNRSPEEGGRGNPDDIKRVEELLWAAEAGASVVDIEYQTRNLAEIIRLIKARSQCLVSFHDMVETPSYDTLIGIATSMIKSGADVCKIITTANCFEDNSTMLKLISRFPETRMVSFAMGEIGKISRILSPLAGGDFTYACMAGGQESAPGQIPIKELREIYGYLHKTNEYDNR